MQIATAAGRIVGQLPPHILNDLIVGQLVVVAAWARRAGSRTSTPAGNVSCVIIISYPQAFLPGVLLRPTVQGLMLSGVSDRPRQRGAGLQHVLLHQDPILLALIEFLGRVFFGR